MSIVYHIHRIKTLTHPLFPVIILKLINGVQLIWPCLRETQKNAVDIVIEKESVHCVGDPHHLISVYLQATTYSSLDVSSSQTGVSIVLIELV